MQELTSIQGFRSLQHRLLAGRDPEVATIVIPTGTCGLAGGAGDLVRTAEREILAKGLARTVRLRVTGCHGFCQMEPSVLIEPGRTFYPSVTPDGMVRIVHAAARGEVLSDLLFTNPQTDLTVERQDEIPFFKSQVRRVLRMSEQVDPTRIYHYIEAGGYEALATVVERASPEWALQAVEESGLRGRGGGGFPTGLKWRMLADQPAGRGKFIVCNADEGDPGAYMDRSVLEGNPHSIIEGMIIGAFATGATEGIVYVRDEYPLAIRHLHTALDQARRCRLLGENILGSGLSFDIQIVRGAGAFVCGEETALIRSIEGKMGEPRQRPPYPIRKGIDGRPTAINNVETWANIPVLFRLGAAEFAEVGAENNSGTKIFSLVGKVRYTGLVEVPMGMTIRRIVDDIGGGAVGKARIKAVQTGGPSGGCIPADLFDLPIDYDSLADAGSIMGSGGMIVMDESTCMVDLAKYFVGFLQDESCGKCFTCRKGTQRMHEILDDISSGRAQRSHIQLLEELALAVKDTTMCGLGQTASNPVLSTLRYFREEYERHVADRRCDAFVCRDLTGASCQSACPLDTEAWRYVALIEKGRYEQAYQVIRKSNPLPAVCARVCDRKCETRCQLGAGGEGAVAIRALKRFITDRVDPEALAPPKVAQAGKHAHKVAVVGAGPAGLAAAHELSGMGHKVVLFDAAAEPGGMLISCIPAYRLPRSIVRQEVAALLNDNVELRCSTMLGRDITIDDLLGDGFGVVFLAIGADRSLTLGLPGETLAGAYSSMEFLKAFHLRGEELAGGHVAVVGGGNSAVDAARVAIRQEHVQSVSLLYRRTGREMPAYAEEVEAAIEEGIALETLVSPVRIRYIEAAKREGIHVETMVEPVKIHSQAGRLVGIECIRNELGAADAGGRRRPVPVPGSEFTLSLNTLIVAIGERPDSDGLAAMGIQTDPAGRLLVDDRTGATSREGVFAGGDVVTGPNTVADAIAAGKRAAAAINRYLRGEPLAPEPRVTLPEVYLEPADVVAEGDTAARAEPPTLPVEARRTSFAEAEMPLSPEQARAEARRCLRCDLAFTQDEQQPQASCAACAPREDTPA